MIRQSLATAACPLAAALLAAGCSTKGAWTEADDLREKLVSAEKQIATLTAERNEALAKLAETERVRLATGGELSSDVAAALPRCAGVEIDRFTGIAPPGDQGAAIEVYLRPFDGRQRFVQIVGVLRVRADLVPAAGQAGSPATVASAELQPADLREAYRSSPMGTHYAVRMPAPANALPPGGLITVSAEFLDAISGQTFTDAKVIGIPRTTD
ncbi:MAG: hypothetical protein SFZ24_03035 [Planctomycetota bacterium]|nr:hypothetical protein [Planctomycetota bacterium]